MARHFMIAALFLETGLLAGGGVVIGQLWVRSEQAEERGTAIREQLQSVQQQLTTSWAEGSQATTEAAEFAAALSKSEGLGERLQTELAGLQRKQLQLEAQNEELLKTAKQAGALSEQVAELKSQLSQAKEQAAAVAESPPADTPPSEPQATDPDDRLVQVQRPEPTVQQAAAQTPAAHFDDSGWHSVRSTPSPGMVVAPTSTGWLTPYPVLYPPSVVTPPSVIVLPQ